MSRTKRILLKLIKKIKHERFCSLMGYRCPDCIYHEWAWEGTTFRGNKCRYGGVENEAEIDRF